ncbi:ribosome biogenesis GTP-binding protein YihA/YsxC [Lutimonas saemankumensis]|uniref:ribosome biogenesis GTP-binding protein YihA/YsxC n=1 Tax=Lutimonas saemankumensis TaxID=483016 RepID=UPI001CD58465|nr:ribosome biogenesis GTP-binding protein YihA/YsxC [Lutimonas saemankumensis]MCA0933593.1 ribosome biogenesis GTP-binding protein YihA/YsxC [Lutimonas saemankumensis]
MKIKSAEFIISNTDVFKCPKENLPEYAFIGRSNVGKSSLINMLTDHKNLAKTSGKPGKTQLINHFLINKSWFLVDLPGYGYASVSKDKRKGFQKFIKDYFNKRMQLACTFVLIDSRHKPQKIDLEFIEYLGVNGIPFCIVFTKADKLNASTLPKNIDAYKRELLNTWEELPTYFVSSSSDKRGREDILSFIEDVNLQIAQQN